MNLLELIFYELFTSLTPEDFASVTCICWIGKMSFDSKRVEFKLIWKWKPLFSQKVEYSLFQISAEALTNLFNLCRVYT